MSNEATDANGMPWFFLARTPEILGFTPGSRHAIHWFDRQTNLLLSIGPVEVVDVADNHLLSVRALIPMGDYESGDRYATGDVFTAYRAGTHDAPYLTFIPCGVDDEMPESEAWGYEDDDFDTEDDSDDNDCC